MKINRIRVFLLSLSLLSVNMTLADEKKTPTWDKDTQAVYDLLIAQMQNAGADYAGSVDTLVKFAKQQKDQRLLTKAFRALLQTERYAEAVDIAELWRKNSTRNVDKFYALALVLNNEADKAVSEIRKKLPSDDASKQEAMLYSYIQLFMASWYHPSVAVVVGKLHQAYPESGIISEAYVSLLRWQGDVDQAVTVIDRFLFKSPKDLALLQEKSDVYRYALRFKDAEKVWEDVLKDYPNNSKFRFAYAQFLYDRYDFTRALQQLTEVPRDETNFSMQMLKMMALVELGDYNAAEKVFPWARLNDDEADSANYNYGDALLKHKQYRRALLAFEKVRDDTELALPAALKIGQIKYADNVVLGDAWFDKVEKKFQLEKDIALRERVAAMHKAGKGQLGYEKFNAYLKSNPKNDDIRYARALLAADMGMDVTAIDDLKLLYATTPDNADVQNALGYTLLSQPDEITYADNLIKKSLFSTPTSPAVADSMGWAKYQKKQYAEALPYFRYAYSQYQDGEIIGHYIMVLMANNEQSLAKKLYQLEIQYQPNREKMKKITRSVEQVLSE